tara:strand:- start:2273 stop:2542 length:270 start_codon:yes stop_codon:yes gene_type:complete
MNNRERNGKATTSSWFNHSPEIPNHDTGNHRASQNVPHIVSVSIPTTMMTLAVTVSFSLNFLRFLGSALNYLATPQYSIFRYPYGIAFV